MAEFPRMLLTNAGRTMLAQAQTGRELVFTKGKYGEGALKSTGDIATMVDLILPKLDLPIQETKASEIVGQVDITLKVERASLENGFLGRELGLFAKIGSAGQEELFCYTNAGEKADYIPPMSDETAPYSDFIDITTTIGNADNVTVIIDKTKVYVTREELDEHKTDPDAHKELFDKISTGVPVGTEMYWPAEGDLPPGFMDEHGQLLPKDGYVGLYAVLGDKYNKSGDPITHFRLPDCRGEFIRVWDAGKGIDPNRTLGSWQKGSLIGGDGTVDKSVDNLKTYKNTEVLGYDAVGNDTNLSTFGNPQITWVTASNINTMINQEFVEGYGMARPRNMSRRLIIKVTDEYINPDQVSMSQLSRDMTPRAEVRKLAGTTVWRDASQIPVKSTRTVVTHNLGLDMSKVTDWGVRLKCVGAEHGYTIGEYAIGAQAMITTGGVMYPITANLTSNTIETIAGSAGTGIAILVKSGAGAEITPSNWRYEFYVIYGE